MASTRISNGQLIEAVRETRARTLELVNDLSDEQLIGPRLQIVISMCTFISDGRGRERFVGSDSRFRADYGFAHRWKHRHSGRSLSRLF